MTFLTHLAALGDVESVVASLTWWHGVVAGVVASLAALLRRHLAERSRRRTIVRLLDRARPGTVVRQGRGAGGPALTVRVDPVPDEQTPDEHTPDEPTGGDAPEDDEEARMTRRRRPRRAEALTPTERAGVDELYRRTHRELMPQAMVLAQGDAPGAEDLVHETFLEVIDNLDEVLDREEDPRTAWLRTVIHNKAVDRWRRAARDVVDSDLTAQAAEEDGDDVTEFAALVALGAAELWAILREMPPAPFRVLYLMFAMRWTTAEVAEALGLSESTVRVHKRNALAFARVRLAEEAGA